MKKLIAGALTAAMVLGTVTPVAVFADEKQDLTLGLMLSDNTNQFFSTLEDAFKKAAEDAVDIFLQNGHKNIGIIGGPNDVFTAQERLEGYKKALFKAGIPVRDSLISHGDYTIQGGVRELEKLVQNNPDMTAVFVTNYEMTMGAIIGVNELGIRIPDQLSVIGFDNLQFARACNPKLTIVSQPTEKIAHEVAEIILDRLNQEEKEKKPVSEKLCTEMIQGRSVAVLGGN